MMAAEDRVFQMKAKDPLLDLILQKYMRASRDSIRGPVALKADVKPVPKHIHEKNAFKNLEPLEEESRLRSTNLDGHTVYSFNVGGERRICFSELVQTVLKDIHVHEIFKKRDNLLIFTSKCSQKQMDELKYHNVLPWTTTSSNLITKSDASRLCGALQAHMAQKAEVNIRSPMSFEVYHECFGGCIGVFDPELYIEANSLCFRCTECNGLYTPRKFVSHNHTSFDEVHTCHWGFDSSRWRCYIMLVEQKASRELLAFWDNIKHKFDSTQPKIKYTNIDQNQDADFVAYINSPDHKKAMISPIEHLRNQEARLESASKYPETGHKETGSAFRPWSPNLSRSLVSKRGESSHHQSSHFLFPSSKNEAGGNRIHPFSNKSGLYSGHSGCSCCPTAPMYMNCQQCKNASHSSSALNMTSRKGNERTCEDVKPKLEPNTCSCDQCKTHDIDNLELSFENVIKNFTSKDMILTTTTRDLAHILSLELKRLNISQDEEIREISISNQRLQTELHLVKMESQKKLNDARETKVHIEQELETLHRDRQKNISMFNQMRWELSREVSNRKSMGEASELGTLQKEKALLKAQLQQSSIERENLQKQLDWHMSQRRSSMDKWTPYPTMAKQFSDDDDNDDARETQSVVKSTHSATWPLDTPQDQIKKENGLLSPVSKSRKLNSLNTSRSSKDDENSDIEVED